ncbi:hypothetical protein L207DRAFT_524312 [Hyaloscypha variabilis F]|uniref:Uncharacterized protein n=1 Tax=Hyaloscypha variabilis (strain UAMH 11265 / GT02V1 / F) TaxID=1149755 RepID=A0A2J6S2A3_HYAVF|nr:hypothetical protein L207DRAFT_524312 [Hyaloscypha variabilis F]
MAWLPLISPLFANMFWDAASWYSWQMQYRAATWLAAENCKQTIPGSPRLREVSCSLLFEIKISRRFPTGSCDHDDCGSPPEEGSRKDMALRVRCCNRSDAVGSRVSQLRSSLREWPPLENLVLLGRQDMNTEGGKSHRSTYSFPDVAGSSSMLGWMLVIRIVPTAARRLKAGCSEIALDSSKGGEKLIITTPHSVLPTPPSSLGTAANKYWKVELCRISREQNRHHAPSAASAPDGNIESDKEPCRPSLAVPDNTMPFVSDSEEHEHVLIIFFSFSKSPLNAHNLDARSSVRVCWKGIVTILRLRHEFWAPPSLCLRSETLSSHTNPNR